jgi:AcrR family transcriptional regulator
MDATEHALATKTAEEITVREISMAAGTNEAMIHYYFGSKEGLLVAMFQDAMRFSPHNCDSGILDSCVAERSIRPLVDLLHRFYHSRPNLMRMTVLELANASSEIKEAYTSRYCRSTPMLIKTIINAMKDANIYRKDVDLTFVSMSLLGMIMARSCYPLLPKFYRCPPRSIMGIGQPIFLKQ